MKSLRNMLRFIVPLLLATLITACGGGGSGGSTSSASSTLGGVAAVGSPIVGGAINVTCAGGSPLTTTTTSTGAWQVTIAGQTPPCAVQVNGGTINSITNATPYLSIATSFGTVNVTPLTNLLLANLAGTATPNVWFAGLTPASFTSITLASVNAALASQCAAFSGLPQLCATNPITTVFSPTSNNIMEYMLISLYMAMITSNTSYASLLQNASALAYIAPAASFNTALTNALTATTSPISAIAINPAQSLIVNSAITSFSPLLPIGGTAPYTYSYTGTLPAGLSFSTSTGVVSGTPTATYATANLVFSVKDASNVTASTTSTVSFTVGAAPISATATTTAQSLTVGTAMISFSPLTASGGTTPYAYSYTGTLPTGLSFSTSTGAVTGTPSALYATANLVFSVKDANNVTASLSSTVSFTVGAAAVGISATANTTAQSLTVGTAMNSFSPLTPSGGTTPYAYSYTGTLPVGLSFSTSTGAVTGTPSATYATANLVFSVKDVNNVVASTTSTVSFTVGAAPGSWTATGSLVTIRGSSPTATLLPNGKVLVTGGANGIALANAELYDLANGLFTATSSMTTGRWGHTATLLPSGKVLITGGLGATILASAELYDPATGLFTATGSMATVRAQHTATLLPNGKVLITGGTPNLATGLTSAELYDPATGLFTATGHMVVARSSHTATLLPNGKVLVAGGVTASAELYEPATGQFTATGSMATARTSHTATLLPSGKVLVIGGLGGLASAALYDPATGLFTATGSMVTATTRYAHTATLLPNGKVLIAGGVEVAVLASAELYDPATGLFTATGSMAAVRISHTATLLPNGKVLAAGGASNASAELYQ